MRTAPHKHHMIHWSWRQRTLAALIIFSLCLSHLNLGSMVTYATDNNPVIFHIGGNITASLSNGILTLSGSGDTLDYSAETAPFLSYSEQIHTLVIESGVTYIGAYLFYGLGRLQGELTLPDTIVGFGDFAFSGSSAETSPDFDIIRNLFEQEEISRPLPPISPSAGDISASDLSVQDTASWNNTVTDGDSRKDYPTYRIETITQQDIPHPDTLFYPGRTGKVISSSDNVSFLNAALSAGYLPAEEWVTVILDDTAEMELPITEGQILLPDCPAQITEAYQHDTLFTHTFTGWTEQPPSAENDSVLKPGDCFQATGQKTLSLYSAWESSCLLLLQVTARLDAAAAIYTLTDGNTGDTVTAPEGYFFSYQWQATEEAVPSESDWLDIAGADAPVYQRTVDPLDSSRQFRCKVTAAPQVRMLAADQSPDSITLYSEAVTGSTQARIIYVSETGNDTDGTGTKDKPFRTTERAAQELLTDENGGTVDNNKIVILGDSYTLKNTYIFNISCPATITGETKDTKLIGKADGDKPLYLYGDIKLESITLETIAHIYGNGHDITFGQNVIASGLYLYGSGQSELIGGKVGKIEVYSGNFTRIVGYVRSKDNVNVQGKKAAITLGGNASASLIIAGSASGTIANADVTINVKDSSSATTIVGGNQGYLQVPSPYTGKTTINIMGGTVGTILGAGSGRNQSIPSYSGQLSINVTGGSVKNIYGAGSAANVTSPAAGSPSTVDITVAGGTVGNIFAAGKGGDTGVTQSDSSFTASPDDFGSLDGKANITITGNSRITGNIYASGEGVSKSSIGSLNYDTSKNAYLKGSATITVDGNAIVKGNIYGGGKGIKESGYEDCGRITEGSEVQVFVKGGTVEGSVYGGGELAQVDGSTSVEISGGTVNENVYGGGHGIEETGFEAFAQLNQPASVTLSGGIVKGNIYGGGQLGKVNSNATVTITNGTVNGSVYGGSLGSAGKSLVSSGSTLNMTGGWVQGNLYGGSEYSDDGQNPAGTLSEGTDAGSAQADLGLVFVNLTGGTVNGKVFGGGYQGKIYGSTHLHIGLDAMGKCSYYQKYSEQKPALGKSSVSIGGSVYAGGDFGGDTVNYDAITITGTSHVYIDGTGYSTGDSSSSDPEMNIAGGVFGSGASCDAGATRLVTLDHYGAAVTDADGSLTGATRTLTSIQRADRVLLLNSHVLLTGQSDIANANQTALYSLNRIGDHPGHADLLAPLGIGLVLQSGSTLILGSASIELAELRSVDADGNVVTLDNLPSCPNTLMLATGTVFQVSTTIKTETDTSETYGPVTGYTYMLAGKTVAAYAYARIKTDHVNAGDGGFAIPSQATELTYINVENTTPNYRYWQVRGESSIAKRNTVLTARQLASTDIGYSEDGYSVAKGVIDLPPANANDTYTLDSITIPGAAGLTLIDAAKSSQENTVNDSWITTKNNISNGADIDLPSQKDAIKNAPMNTFGLYMKLGSGFTSDNSTYDNKVISGNSALSSGGTNSALGAITSKVQGDNIVPQIEFYLTYYNNNISSSRDLGEVEIKMTHNSNGIYETIYMYVNIVTKASSLTEQTVDLYATQTGAYTGRLNIPEGSSRELRLTSVTASPAGSLVTDSAQLSAEQFSISMKPVASNGWKSAGLMTAPYDLGVFTASSSQPVAIGTTDSRYEAPIEFTLKNKAGFSPKDTPDTVMLIFEDANSDKITVKLQIHWKASVVSSITSGSGKQYNGESLSQADIMLSQYSSLTAAFTLAGSYAASGLWLEVQAQNKEVVGLPAGAKLTLLIGQSFYSYTAEAQINKIPLSYFKQMWGSASPEGTISGTLTVIVDFEGTAVKLAPGQYSLRLRDETGADSMGASFTVNNNTSSCVLAYTGNLSQGEHTFTLTVSPNSDTRLSDGMAAVLSLNSGNAFPEGTVFRWNNNGESGDYYPSGSKVYLPLTGNGPYTITMDTGNSAGLNPGADTLSAKVFPTGFNCGDGRGSISCEAPFTVKPAPSYALRIGLNAGGTRSVKSGDTVAFIAEYSAMHITDASVSIEVRAQVKKDSGYEDCTPSWDISGNVPIAPTSGSLDGRQTITAGVPDNLTPGTYRLLFTLGGQEVPFNIIVTEK